MIHAEGEQSQLQALYCNHCKAMNIKPNTRVHAELGKTGPDQETFDLARNYLGRIGFRAFLEVVNVSTELKALILKDNGLDNDTVVAMCRVLSKHPTLAVLDVSSNPISLAAGQSLLELVQKNVRITQIDVSNTGIETRIVDKIMLQVASNGRFAQKKPQSPTPFEQAKIACSKEKRKEKEAKTDQKGGAAPKEERGIAEVDDATMSTVINRDCNVRIPQRSRDGWVILNLYIACSRSDFLSELALIHNKLIPDLNKRLAARQVYLHPYAMYHDPEGETTLRSVDDDKLPPSTDPQQHFDCINRCRPFYIALVGDKVGWTPHNVPEDRAFDKLRAGTQAPMNVLETVYGQLSDLQATVGLYFFRQSAKTIGTPEGIIETLSDEYTYFHPDPDGTVVVVGADAGQPMQDGTRGDPTLRRKRWDVYCDMKKNIHQNIDPALIVDGYHAAYKQVDKYGAVSVTGLEEFEHHFTDRVWSVVTHFYPDEGLTVWYKQPSVNKCVDVHPAERKLYFSRVPMLIGRKKSMAHLESYIVSPPSRNMLLVVTKEGMGSTALLAEAARKTALRRNYKVISSFVNHNGLCSEAFDLRSVLLGLCQQMLPEGTSLPATILDTVIMRDIKDYWLNMLKNHPPDKNLVIIIDNLDKISFHPKMPPRINIDKDTRVDPMEHDEAALMWPFYDWIPVALPKNVRLIGSMYETSRARLDELVRRGVDACATYPLTTLEPKDAELFVNHRIGAKGSQMTEDDMKLIMLKKHHLLPQFLAITSDLLNERLGKVNYYNTTTFLEMLPMTIEGLCEQALERAERETKVELVRWFCGLLIFAREGLLELEVRELLVEAGRKRTLKMEDGSLDDHKLNLEQLSHLLKILRPFLHPYLNGPHSKLGAKLDERDLPEACINGTNCLLGISNSTFGHIARGRYLRSIDQELEVHATLAKYYKSKSDMPCHPLRIKGMRNFPYHMIKSQMWQPFMQSVVTLDYTEKAFANQIGYQLYRDLHFALAAMNSYYVTQARIKSTGPAFLAWLERCREFIEFLTNARSVLSFRPSLTYQEALITKQETSTYIEASQHFTKNSTAPHCSWLNRSRAKSHGKAVTTSIFSPNGMRILTTSLDRTVKFCNLLADPIHYPRQNAEVLFAVYSVTSKYVVTATQDRILTIFDATTGARLGNCEGHNAPLAAADFSVRGRYLASGDEDREMRVWDTESQKCLALASHKQYVTGGSPHRSVCQVACHPSKDEVFLSACDKTVLIWQLQPQNSQSVPENSAKCIKAFVAHTQYPVFFAKWSPTASYVISAVRVTGPDSLERMPTKDSIIKIWSVDNARVVARLVGAPSQQPVNAVTLSRCSSMVAMSSPNKMCSVWKVEWFNTLEPDDGGIPEDGEWQPKEITPHSTFYTDGVPKHVSFSHGSSHLAAACDTLLQVWRIPSRDPVLEFMTRFKITCLDWSANPDRDSGQILAGDDSGRVYLLKVNNVEEDPKDFVEN